MRYLIALFALTLALPNLAAATAAVDDYAMQAKEVAPNVYAVISPAKTFPNEENKGWNSNSAFVVTDDGLLVFDTGSSETIGKALLKTIRSVSDAPIRWVINSHSHGDHWLGNGAFKPSGAEIIASAKVKQLMEKDGFNWVDRFNRMSGGATGTFEPVPATKVVEQPLSRSFGGVEVQILFSGDAHSPGDIVFWLPQKKVLLTGDVMYTGRPPATFDAKVKQWVAFLDRLHGLEPKVMVPGHGPVGDNSDIANLHDYFKTLWDTVSAGYDEGMMSYEIKPMVVEKMARFESIYPNMEERLGESISHVYLQVEAEAF